MVKLVTIAVTKTQKDKIQAKAQVHATKQGKKLSVYFRELKSKLPPSECRGTGKNHCLIKTTHALRRKVIDHPSRARVKCRGKWISCYTKAPKNVESDSKPKPYTRDATIDINANAKKAEGIKKLRRDGKWGYRKRILHDPNDDVQYGVSYGATPHGLE